MVDGGYRGARRAMHDALNVHPNIRVLELLDALSAPVAMGKERERIARDLIENRIVVAAREGHRQSDTGHMRGRASERTVLPYGPTL